MQHVATTRLPVEQVTWSQAQREFVRVGLGLPGKWKYAARERKRYTWYFGKKKRECFVSFENLKDESNAGGTDDPQEQLADGFRVTAPVGSFLASSFGLHDMLGNVKPDAAPAVGKRSSS